MRRGCGGGVGGTGGAGGADGGGVVHAAPVSSPATTRHSSWSTAPTAVDLDP
jgi:hypothetical protein